MSLRDLQGSEIESYVIKIKYSTSWKMFIWYIWSKEGRLYMITSEAKHFLGVFYTSSLCKNKHNLIVTC